MRYHAVLLLMVLCQGCIVQDGMVGIEGWVTTAARGDHGDVLLIEGREARPPTTVAPVSVELWTANTGECLDSWSSTDGYFAVGHIGPYQQGLLYRIKATSSGYAAVNRLVRLKPGNSWGRIYLLPAD